MKAKFYINTLIRFGIKEQSAHYRVIGQKNQHQNLKYEIQDLVIFHEYELNIIKESTFATCSGKIYQE